MCQVSYVLRLAPFCNLQHSLQADTVENGLPMMPVIILLIIIILIIIMIIIITTKLVLHITFREKSLLYAVKVQRSLAPLSGFVVHTFLVRMNKNVVDFRVMIRMKVCAIAYEIYKRNLHCVIPHKRNPGIHDNGPRDQALWRLTLTAY